MNKIDRIRKPKLLSVFSAAERFSDRFLELVPVCALSGDGVPQLVELFKKHLPEGPKYFPDDMFTDQPEVFYIAEIVREKIFNLTRREIPYRVAVAVCGFSEDEEKNLVSVNAEIYVERKSHKGILIGKGGAMLKRVGSEARADVERVLGGEAVSGTLGQGEGELDPERFPDKGVRLRKLTLRPATFP